MISNTAVVLTLRLSCLILALQLSGCDSFGNIASCTDGHCRPPVESVNEIRSLGSTITTSSRPLPDSVDTILYTRESDGEAFISSNLLELYFSPSMNFSNVANPDSISNDWADHPYAFTFSQENDGEFTKIKPIIPSNAFLFEGTVFGPLAVTNDPAELIVHGNHVLKAPSAFPLRATHVEIWVRQERRLEFTLMNRIRLNSLTAWNRYLLPEVVRSRGSSSET